MGKSGGEGKAAQRREAAIWKKKSLPASAIAAGCAVAVAIVTASCGGDSAQPAEADWKQDAVQQEGSGQQKSQEAQNSTGEAVPKDTGDGYLLASEDPVSPGEPETLLNPQEIYGRLTYVPEMFYDTYRLVGGEEAIAAYQQEMDYMEFREYRASTDTYLTKNLTAIPYAVSVGTWAPDIPGEEGRHWMRMSVKDEEGYLVDIGGAYTVEGNRLILRPVQETGYDKEASAAGYGLSDETLEYEFAFCGNSLTLSRDGKSVTLHEGYIKGTENHPYLYADSYLAQGSAQIDDIIGFDILWDGEGGEYNRFHVMYEDNDGKKVTSYQCTGTMTPEGLFTFTVPYDLELSYPAERKTYQFVYVCCEDGLILADGEAVYFYNCGRGDYEDYRLSDVLDGARTEDLTDSQTETLLAAQSNILKNLETAFAEADVEADIDHSTGKVTMDDSILFAYDDAALSEAGKEYLDSFLNIYSAVITDSRYSQAVASVLVEGHTDTNGSYEYNMTLSQERAQAVSEYCISRQPALAGILQARGCSYDNPIYDRDGNVDMEASRRVSFRFILNIEP